MKKSELKTVIKEEIQKIFEAMYKFNKYKWSIQGNYLVVEINNSEEADKIVTWIRSLGDEAKAITTSGNNKVLINMNDVCIYYLNNHI